jgi:hypothetical protein
MMPAVAGTPTSARSRRRGRPALALVISLNVQRRDLTTAQRAIVAAKALPMFEELAKQRMAEGGKSKGKGGTVSATHRARDDANKTFKVGHNAGATLRKCGGFSPADHAARGGGE